MFAVKDAEELAARIREGAPDVGSPEVRRLMEKARLFEQAEERGERLPGMVAEAASRLTDPADRDDFLRSWRTRHTRGVRAGVPADAAELAALISDGERRVLMEVRPTQKRRAPADASAFARVVLD